MNSLYVPLSAREMALDPPWHSQSSLHIMKTNMVGGTFHAVSNTTMK
jgi:hypothetical protein